MEAIKLQHLNLHATVASPFSLSWSEDDKIAITTHEGINILVFDPDPENDKWKFTFKRSNIQRSVTDPFQHINIYTNDIVCSVERLDAYRLILDAAMVPGLNGLVSGLAYPTTVTWSPAGTLANARCALASVDSYGQATVVVPDMAGSHQTIDLTAIWVAHCIKDWPQVDDKAEARLQELVARSTQLRSTAIAWAPRKEGAETTQLVMSQRNGQLVWFDMKRDGTTSVVAIVAPGLGLVTVLVALAGYTMAAGCIDGRVSVVTADGEARLLWAEADRAAITWMHHLPQAKVLMAMKGSFVVAMGLDDGSVAVEAVDSMFIGGATPMNDSSVCLATQAGELSVATASRDNQGRVVLKVTPLPWPAAAAGTSGLARSRNSAVWALLNSHVDCHDCTPTQLTFFHVMAATPDPVAAVLSSPSVWLVRDQLELLRSLLMQRRMEGTSPLPHLVYPTLPARWDGLPAAQLRVWRWLTVARAAHEKRVAKKDERPLDAFPHNKHHPMYKEVLRIEHLLVLDNCCRRVPALIEKAEALTSDERLSLAVMRRYLAAVVETSMGGVKSEETSVAEQAEGPSEVRVADQASESGEVQLQKAGCDETGLTDGAKKTGKKSKSIGSKKAEKSGKSGTAGEEQETEPTLMMGQVLEGRLEREPGVSSLGPGPTLERVLATLALEVPLQLPTIEPCALCGADSSVASVSSSLCTRGHTLPRCALSLRQLVETPYLVCTHCDLVVFPDIEATPTCIFCDAPLEMLST